MASLWLNASATVVWMLWSVHRLDLGRDNEIVRHKVIQNRNQTKKHQLWLNILTSNQPLFPITERKTEHLQMIHSYIIKSMEYVERIEPHALIHAGCDVTCPHNNQAEQGHVIYKFWWSSPALFTKTEKWMDTLSFKELQSLLEKHERQTYVNRNIATYASKRYPAIHCNL